MGRTGCLDPRELKHSDFLLVWGSNMKATRIQSMPVLDSARKAGKRVVLIESCAEDMAPYCDETILIRPGTDGALALAMMHVLVREGLAAEDYLREWSCGWPGFKETLPAYTPVWAEGITGIPADVTEALAMEYGRGLPARHHTGKRSLPLWERRYDRAPDYHTLRPDRGMGQAGRRAVRM